MPTDNSLRFSSCIKCGNEDISDNASFCKKCGTYLYNNCTNSDNQCDYLNPPDAFYCEICGSESYLLVESAEQTQMDPNDFVEMSLRGV
ncbi:hypothetical protein CN676_04030 [Bacillus wiedmannii]|uniref:double zinc ribbon domain-containing protein n=1 Tax=Bacillus wiedmannii TaxID=1890302 RepID=UPI000BEDAD56|nr:zinc ribbon domain-containing protein [Bacillus wiedmannii]PEA79106.1 hypothetical protein CON92_00615 [Bacillus wiedmannii]PEG08488.1 hypothetical protein CON96_21925 [Bacillus wiedmannii]PEJ55822.1 hypothetical protein CN676_04030 [Bacillus wiedmannii]PHA68241.1 hypothetical protein COE75_03230 [Bacillus wiedmannii]